MMLTRMTVVLKQAYPDTGISNKAMAILNSFVNDIFERIATEPPKYVYHPYDPTIICSIRLPDLTAYSNKSPICSREIQTSVYLILPGELAKHAISQGNRSVTFVFPLSSSFLYLLTPLFISQDVRRMWKVNAYEVVLYYIISLSLLYCSL